jgi:hypothetical protein
MRLFFYISSICYMITNLYSVFAAVAVANELPEPHRAFRVANSSAMILSVSLDTASRLS